MGGDGTPDGRLRPPSPGFSRAQRGPRGSEPGARSPGGGAVAVRAGPGCGSREVGARRCGRAAAKEEKSGAVTVNTRPQKILSRSPAVSAFCAPFPLPHPFPQTTLGIRTLQFPPLLGLGPCKLQDPRVPARKIETIDERKNYTYT